MSYVVFGLAAASFFGLICMLKNIKLAIAIIKTATVYIVETPSAMFVPPIVAIVIAIWWDIFIYYFRWAIWILGFIHVYAVGDFFKSNYSVFG